MFDDDDDALEIETLNMVPEGAESPLEPAAPEALPVDSSDPFESEREAPRKAAPFGRELASLDPANDMPAKEADARLNDLLTVFQEHVTKIAQVVHRIRSQALYRNLGYDTFEAYIKSKELRMSRSFIYQLAKVGEVIEKAGVDVEHLPATQDLQISKLAQISRLPDPEIHRKVLETGRITLRNDSGLEEDYDLNTVPVKKLNAHVNEALGIPPKIGHAYDPIPDPAFKGAGQTGTQNAAAYQTIVAAERAPEITHSHEGWQGMLEGMVAELRVMSQGDRQDAVAEIVRVIQATVNDAVPF